MATAELVMPAVPVVEPEGLYEVIDGATKEKLMGLPEVWIASYISQLLAVFVRANGSGRVLNEALFRTKPGRKRRPDVAFLSAERWPLDRKFPERDALEIAPDIAIEVVSPTDLAVDLNIKIAEYFRAEVRQVWVVYRRTAMIEVHESTHIARKYGPGDVLDGGVILPGFTLPISDLGLEPDDGTVEAD